MSHIKKHMNRKVTNKHHKLSRDQDAQIELGLIMILLLLVVGMCMTAIV